MTYSQLTGKLLRGGLVLSLAAVTSLTVATPSYAGTGWPTPPTTPCTQTGPVHEITIDSAEIQPVVTHFIAINIAPGTTGERTETLAVMNTVTTSINLDTEFSMDIAIKVFGGVSLKTGLTVKAEISSTSSETTSMKWTFSQPGYYGLYKGTRKVSGNFVRWYCYYPVGARSGRWVPLDVGHMYESYTTYTNMEYGTLTCGDTVPPHSIREQARLQLGC